MGLKLLSSIFNPTAKTGMWSGKKTAMSAGKSSGGTASAGRAVSRLPNQSTGLFNRLSQAISNALGRTQKSTNDLSNPSNKDCNQRYTMAIANTGGATWSVAKTTLGSNAQDNTLSQTATNTYNTMTGSDANKNTFSQTGASVSKSVSDSARNTFETMTGSDPAKNTFSQTGASVSKSATNTFETMTGSDPAKNTFSQTGVSATKSTVSTTDSTSESGASVSNSTRDSSGILSRDDGRGVESSGTRSLQHGKEKEQDTLVGISAIIKEVDQLTLKEELRALTAYHQGILNDKAVKGANARIGSNLTEILQKIKALPNKGDIISQTIELNNMIDGIRTGTSLNRVNAQNIVKAEIKRFLETPQ